MAKRRRFPSFFDDDFDPFADFDQIHDMMEDLLKRSVGDLSAKPGQPPLVYGFSMRVGSDGKPQFHQFGNVKEGKVSKEREPLVDVVDLDKEIRVVAELPGVQKEDIHISSEKNELLLQVDDKERPFSKRIRLPADVVSDKAKASYNNGILEVVLTKLSTSRRKDIRVD